ncbi:carboxypeptidase-like regulatory domain-containing protein [Polaribacter marinivivus]|uniref:Carboxypeptidase-like regulatory domain-containing protein n=1 Tax=Polaribacter marinivivus TaxID=1524260 RepID=A0ABV8R769_9FLAO
MSGSYNLNKIVIIFFYFLLFQTNITAQIKIKGLVKKNKDFSLSNASVVLKDSLNTILEYTFTDKNGNYLISTNKKSSYILFFSALGYETKSIPITYNSNEEIISINIILKEKPYQLKEVIIEAEKPIKIKKDTIEVKVNRFLKPNDATVEDLLKKIPGVTVNSEGTIKIGNREIEKLMVDGDDFFEKGYKILSKNMPPNQLEKIQILQKYSNNRLLKDIEESNKVALNLVLKEDAKRKWFGNFSANYGLISENRYQLKTYAMNFGKKNKYILLSNFNNLGEDATGDINNLIRPFRFGEPASIGDNQQINNLLSLSFSNGNFKKSRTNFNNAELVSLNAIFNPTKKLKIKTLCFFNWDETDFFRNSTETFTANNTNFTNTENYTVRNTKQIAFGKLDIIYNISPTKMLEATTKYNNGDFFDNTNLIFNGNSTIESLEHQNTLIDQKINYTNKFINKKILLLTGRFIDEKAPQNYSINQFFYQNLFPNQTNVDNVKQQSENQMIFAGLNAHLLDRKENENLFEVQVGNEFRQDKLFSTFTLLNGNNRVNSPINYQNNTTYSVNNLYLKTKYLLALNKFKLIGDFGFHQLFNRLETNLNHSTQNPFFINPSFGFNWEINDKNKLTTSYSYNTTNAKIVDVYSNFVLTGFRSFSKGTGNFNQLEASNISVNYQLGNWSDRFFANTFFIYSKNHDFFSTNSIINQNYTQSEKILIKDREFISLNSTIDYYLKNISSNLKFNFGYSKSQFKNIINNSDLRNVSSFNYNYGFELRSGFSGIFNYHFGTKWITSEIRTTINNSFTDNNSFLDLSFIFSDKFDIELKSERYYFGNLQSNNTYYFLDLDIRYKLFKNKMTLGIVGKNLTNTEQFKNFSISDVGSSIIEYRLLPRFVLLKLDYRF